MIERQSMKAKFRFISDFMSIGFFVAVGGFAWFDGWKETTITNPDNFKTIFVFLRFEIRPIEESS